MSEPLDVAIPARRGSVVSDAKPFRLPGSGPDSAEPPKDDTALGDSTRNCVRSGVTA